jgi:Tfp pilus assembly protein PilX
MTQISGQNGRHSESGMALLIAIFTLLLITAIGAGMIMLTNTETSTSANFRDEQTALFSAKAGIEEIRDRFRKTATNSLNASLPGAVMGLGNNCLVVATCGVLYVLNPTGAEADTPWVTNGNAYPDDEVCTEAGNMAGTHICTGSPLIPPGKVPPGNPWYASTTASATYAATPPMAWKWTRITLKTNLTSSGTTNASTVDGTPADTSELVCWNGTNEVSSTYATCALDPRPNLQPVYVMTTLAVTPSGSRRMIQTEATTTTFPTLPGPMIFDGPTPVYGAPNSNAFGVTGIDQAQGPNAGAGCPAGVNEPALGGYDAASVAALTADVPRPAKYTGAVGTGSPSVSNVSAALGPLATVAGLDALVSQVTMIASPANIVNGNAAGIANPGTNAVPVINVVTGDLTLGGGFSGSGILLVEGNLTMSGNPGYNGLILVIGKGTVTKNGGGNGTLDGSLLVANLYDNSSPTPHLLPLAGPPGIPTMNWNGGGNASINYDSCWSSALSLSLPYKIVGVREMMY